MKKLLSALIAVILCFGTACAAEETGVSASPDTLRSMFEDAGFYVQNGTLYEFDTLRLASEGKLLTCFGNNAGSAYLILDLPPAPEQDAAVGNEERGWVGERATAYDDPDIENWPANPFFNPAGIHFKLRQDETGVGASYYELVNDRVIVFHKK